MRAMILISLLINGGQMTHGEQIREYDDVDLSEFFDDIVIDVENRVKTVWNRWFDNLEPEEQSALQVLTECDIICAWLCAEAE